MNQIKKQKVDGQNVKKQNSPFCQNKITDQKFTRPKKYKQSRFDNIKQIPNKKKINNFSSSNTLYDYFNEIPNISKILNKVKENSD